MSHHIGAEPGQIAETVLMPGDPLRAKWIAETFLEGAECYSTVRNMFGFTGQYKGHRISIQGSGMGMPSASIYTHELLADYGVKTIVRVGSAGSIQDDVNVRDVVIGIGAATDSSMNTNRFAGQLSYAPVADYGLLSAAAEIAAGRENTTHVGQILSSDVFYGDSLDTYKKAAEYGVLAVEMEAAALYTLAAKFKARALTICTISDHIFKNEALPADQRERTFGDMVEIALEAVTR